MKIRFGSIHRETLRKTLHLPDKIDADFEGTFANVKCYGGWMPKWWTKVVPDDGIREAHVRQYDTLMGKFTIKVTKGHNKAKNGSHKSSTHRVFVVCKCGKDVPAGRLGQHRCAHWPTKEMIEAHANHKDN